jgi:hypothetical protein
MTMNPHHNSTRKIAAIVALCSVGFYTAASAQEVQSTVNSSGVQFEFRPEQAARATRILLNTDCINVEPFGASTLTIDPKTEQLRKVAERIRSFKSMPGKIFFTAESVSHDASSAGVVPVTAIIPTATPDSVPGRTLEDGEGVSAPCYAPRLTLLPQETPKMSLGEFWQMYRDESSEHFTYKRPIKISFLGAGTPQVAFISSDDYKSIQAMFSSDKWPQTNYNISYMGIVTAVIVLLLVVVGIVTLKKKAK